MIRPTILWALAIWCAGGGLIGLALWCWNLEKRQ